MRTYTEAEAWEEIEWCSGLIATYAVKSHRWGCGTLEGCREGDRCDVLDHVASLWARLHAARLAVSA